MTRGRNIGAAIVCGVLLAAYMALAYGVYWISITENRQLPENTDKWWWVFPVLCLAGVIIYTMRALFGYYPDEHDDPAQSVRVVASAAPPERHATPSDPGPGKYELRGVLRESGRDARLTCTAQSEANARVKAELKGLVVTSATRVG